MKTETPVGPSADLIPLEQAVDATTTTVIWGMEGTGKTLIVLRSWPLPLLDMNLDRHLSPVHLGMVSADRRSSIFVKNIREDMKDLEKLSMAQAQKIKSAVETTLQQNLAWLKGGTFLIDGGTMYRYALKMADDTIGKKLAEGQRMAPKDKEAVNAYLATLVSYIADQGIHLVITGHAAWAWKMIANDSGGSNLQRTTSQYPKLDDILFERTTASLLMFKRCQCGRAIVSQDGTCESATIQTADKHRGRQHVTRIVTNKFDTRTEGTEWPDFDYAQYNIFCFDRARTDLLLRSKGK